MKSTLSRSLIVVCSLGLTTGMVPEGDRCCVHAHRVPPSGCTTSCLSENSCAGTSCGDAVDAQCCDFEGGECVESGSTFFLLYNYECNANSCVLGEGTGIECLWDESTEICDNTTKVECSGTPCGADDRENCGAPN